MREGVVHNYTDIRLNEEGFQDVFQRYYVSLSLFANRYVDDEEVAADIVQDVFAKLWQIRTDFFYLHQVKSFLYTSVRNKALNELEHRHVMSEYAQRVVEKQKEAFFHDAVIEQETYRVLVEAIDRLPSQMKAIMLLALEGKKNAEIADRLEISVETVHTLKKMAYKKLRHFLNHYYYTLLWMLCV
ncbi:MAG: RNA polymerase sigma-70 factor [Bacteroides sp.]